MVFSDQVSPPRLCALHVPNSTYRNIFVCDVSVYRASGSILLLNGVPEISIDA